MKKIAVALAAASALLAAPAAMAGTREKGEAELSKMLEGREAGKPVDCLPYSANRDVKVIDKTALVYGSGRTIYVNRPTNADDLDDNDILVTEQHTPQLCRLETVRLHDRSGHFFTGFVGLEHFVPYTRIAKAD